MKKIIAITLTVITIVQLFTFSSFAMDNNPTINEVVEAVVADYSSTTTAAQKKILNKARAASSIEYEDEQEEAPKKTSAIVEFFNKVATFFKSIGDWFRNLFKKPEKPSPEPTPTPIKYYEPYADPDPTGEHIRENNYIASEPYVNKNGLTFGMEEERLLPNMCKIASWVEPEYLNAYPKMTYKNKSIHIGSTEDYMLYTFGRPIETITYHNLDKDEFNERIHVYILDDSEIVIFYVIEFNMGTFNFNYLDRNYEIDELYQYQSKQYGNNLPTCLSEDSLNVARTLQTAISGIYTNSKNAMFESSGLIKTKYTKVSTIASLDSYEATIIAEPSTTINTINDYEKRCSASGLTKYLTVKENEATIFVEGKDLTKLHNLQAYNPENNTYSFRPHTSGNEMIIEYYFDDDSNNPSGINVSLAQYFGSDMNARKSIGSMASRLSNDTETNKNMKIRLFSYIINSTKKQERDYSKFYSLDEVNAFIDGFWKKITI